MEIEAPGKPSGRSSKWVLHLSLSLAIVGAAFWLRFHLLPTVPLGWHPDEATKGIIAREVLAGGPWPVFFSQFTGREGLFIYLEALAFSLFGESIFSGRILSAFVGVLTVALTVPLGPALWPGGQGKLVGRWSAALLAVSMWHLVASRNGYRAVLQPLTQLPAIILLLHAVNRQAGNRPWTSYALAGFFTGLTLYTYTAARVFPLVIAAIGLAAVVVGPGRAKRLAGTALALAVAALTAAPLLMHFNRNPADFYGRAAQISIWNPEYSGGDVWGLLWQNVRDTAGMFATRGDPNFRFNIADWPVFGPVLGGLFFLGLVLAAARVLRRESFLPSAALLAWVIVMLLPMVLSAESIPYYQRAIGVLPAVMVFPVLLLVAVGSSASGWRGALRIRLGPIPSMEAGLLFPFVGLVLVSQQSYLREWHGVPENDRDRRVAMVYLADYLNSQSSGEEFYVSTEYPQHPTLAFLSPGAYDRTRWIDVTQALALPPEGKSAAYFVLLEKTPDPALLSIAGLAAGQTVPDRFGQPAFTVYRWAGDWPSPSRSEASWSWATDFSPGWQSTSISAPINFQDTATLLGYDLSTPSIAPGETMKLILFWSLAGPTTEPFIMFAHLLGTDSRVVAGFDANRYPSTLWHSGELLLSSFPLSVPADTPPGSYQLEVGLYNLATQERLFVLNGDEPVANRLLLQPIRVE